MNTTQERIAEYLTVEIGLPPVEAGDRAVTICKKLEERVNQLKQFIDAGNEQEQTSRNEANRLRAEVHKLEDRLKTAASMLRSAVYERTPLGDKWIDHFDVERQKAITEFLASVEGKP